MFTFLNKQAYGRLNYLKFSKYCTKIQEETSESTIPESGNVLEKGPNHKKRLEKYFESNSKRRRIKQLLPEKCFGRSQRCEHLYLIDPDVAQEVVSKISTFIKKDVEIAETNPGLGLITQNLLDSGVKSVRLYEPSTHFRQILMKYNEKYPNRLKLFTKDFFRIAVYIHIDKIDNGNRAEQLFHGIEKKNWNDDPVLYLIGTAPNTDFLKNSMRALAMQTPLIAYGRIEMFLIMKAKDYLVVTGEAAKFNIKTYRYLTVLFNLFFDYKLIGKLPRQAFLPWDSPPNPKEHKIKKIDPDKMYLVHIEFKKDFPISPEEFLAFYYFTKQLFRANSAVVPTLENWVPGCGENVIWPKLKHEHYFEDMNIFTEFHDLSPKQLIEVFREMHGHPSYNSSPFLSMIETEMVKSETVESQNIPPTLEKRIIKDIEINLDAYSSYWFSFECYS